MTPLALAISVGLLLCSEPTAAFVAPDAIGQRAYPGWRLIRVVDLYTGMPVPYPVVRVNGDRNRLVVQVRGDQSGRAVVRDLPVGWFRVGASATGFVTPLGLAGERSEFEVTESDAGGQTVVALEKTSGITGTVMTAGGQPLANVGVVATRIGPGQVDKELSPDVSGRTDDQGEFSLIGLRQGQYALRTVARPMWTRSGVTEGLQSTAIVPNESAARPFGIVLKPGVFEEDVTVVVDIVPFRRVKGRVDPSGLGGTQIVGGTLNLRPVRSQGVFARGDLVAQLDSAGSFEFRDVADGEYVLSGEVEPGAFVSQIVTVNEQLVPEVGVPVEAGYRVVGKVVAQGHPGTAPPTLPARLRLAPVGSNDRHVSGGVRDVAIGADGRFEAAGIVPAQYAVRVAGLGAAVFVTHPGARGPVGPMLNVTGDLESVSVTLTTAVGRIEGRLDVKEQSERMVVLFPDDFETWEDSWVDVVRFQAQSAGLNGKFVIDSVPPGDYRVAFLPASEAATWRSRASLKNLSVTAQRVSVLAGGVHIVSVRANAR